MQTMSDTADKMAILASMEKVLMETGADYNLVLAKLRIQGITLMDCCIHPKYLNEILIDVYGSKSKDIIHGIMENLVGFDESKGISEFLDKLKQF